jgi:hypothetical protein
LAGKQKDACPPCAAESGMKFIRKRGESAANVIKQQFHKKIFTLSFIVNLS